MKLETIMGASALSIGLLLASGAQAVPVLDGGWDSDEIDAVGVPSINSPYVFSLASDAYFRITDAFAVGDIFQVFNEGNLILTTTFQAFAEPFGDNATADSGWTSDSFSSAELLLTAGDYEISITGDGAGGLPAGFFTRLDSVAPVPLPASLGLLGLALAGLAVSRRKS